jgi:hypothetical protein
LVRAAPNLLEKKLGGIFKSAAVSSHQSYKRSFLQNCLDSDKPIPLEAPVMKTCFPEKDEMKLGFFLLELIAATTRIDDTMTRLTTTATIMLATKEHTQPQAIKTKI